MFDGLRYFLARHVVHFPDGMTLGDWWQLSRKHRFAVSPGNWPRVAFQVTVSLTNSINRLSESLKRRIADEWSRSFAEWGDPM